MLLTLQLSQLKRIQKSDRIKGAKENPMHRGVVVGATKGAGSAKGRESVMSGEVFLEVVS
jgi:hypothetical protein